MRKNAKEALQALQMLLAKQDVAVITNPKPYIEDAYRHLYALHTAVDEALWALSDLNAEIAIDIAERMKLRHTDRIQDCYARNEKARKILEKALWGSKQSTLDGPKEI